MGFFHTPIHRTEPICETGKLAMITGRHHDQVLGGIVQAIAINVMDVLIRCQKTAQYLLHHVTVFELPSSLAWDFNLPVQDAAFRFLHKATTPNWQRTGLLGLGQGVELCDRRHSSVYHGRTQYATVFSGQK